MLKKTIITMALVLFAGVLTFGHNLRHVVRTAGCQVREAVRAEVPIEFEIDRARRMARDLDPEIRKAMEVVAEQTIDIEALRTKLSEKELALKTQKDVVLALRSDLEQGDESYVYAEVEYSADEVQADLERRFDAYKRGERSLEADRKMLAAREQVLKANQEKLEKMLEAKQHLEVQVAELEAQLRQLEAEEVLDREVLDDSHLTRTKKLIDDIDRRIAVRKKMRETEGKYIGRIPLGQEATSDRDVTSEIDEHFQKPAKTADTDSTPGDAVEAELTSF